MDVDGEKGDVEMASESDSDDMSSADEAKENELNQQKSSLLNRVCLSLNLKSFIVSVLTWTFDFVD